MPRARSSVSAEAACSGFSIRTLSVTSRTSCRGWTPVRANAVRMLSTRRGDANWRLERFTATVRGSLLSAVHAASCSQAASSIHPTQGNDETRLLGDGDEIEGGDEATGGVLPPDQCLETPQAPVAEREDRLEVEEEL